MTATVDEPRPLTRPAGLSPYGFLDVRGRLGWKGLGLPVEVGLEDGVLRLRVKKGRHTRRQRLALQDLCGSQGLGRLAALGWVDIEVPLSESSVSFPRVPLLGRSAMKIRLPSGKHIGLGFLDTRELADAHYRGMNVLADAARVARKGPEARRAREAWRREIERWTRGGPG